MNYNKKLYNKIFFLLLYILCCSCSLLFKNSTSRVNKSQNLNNYPNNYYPNSRVYVNPYQYPSYYGYQGNQDYDQFYKAPMQYNNIEVESKSVILYKY